MEIQLFDLIVNSAKKALKLQNSDGSMPAGHNGPYQDQETPVRNTSHWLITFVKAFNISGNVIYMHAAEKCFNYLLKDESRPMKSTFWHRSTKNKDFSNGLVGQAWTIEALVIAYDLFNDAKLLNIAEEVYMLHPYDFEMNCWKTVNVDGSIHGFDPTFNHQLWFCASGSMLVNRGCTQVLSMVENFTNNIGKNIGYYKDGVIQHAPIFYQKIGYLEKFKTAIREIKKPIKIKEELYSKSIGYHGFNLYALAILKEENPEFNLNETIEFRKSLEVLDNEKFFTSLKKSKYSYHYNPPGIEFAYALQVFDKKKDVKIYLNDHFERTFDFNNWSMNLGSVDTFTSQARIYEACRLENYTLSI